MSNDQIPYEPPSTFDESIFVENPEPRCPCVLLLDKSYSMSGRPIEQLNDGLVPFKSELVADPLAAKRVEVAIVSFGPVERDLDFTSAEHFNPPRLAASSNTPMGAAICEALDMVESRKGTYKANGVAYYRPWVFLITDGAPTDSWNEAARRIHEGEERQQFAFFAVGVEGADMETLAQIARREPLRLEGLQFRELFQWLSKSLTTVSHSHPDEEIALPPPGWAKL